MHVIKSTTAEDDLFEIWHYIAQDNLLNANKFLAEFDKKFEFLAANPFAGILRNEIENNLRSTYFGNYTIFYSPLEDGGGVKIARVLHSRRDTHKNFS